ncbi:MAG: DUF1275 domain-containing protein [Alicyclobacillus sp.]|nr:DUF1275 domain-containing protein [Alicyclobacillus sp.]
MSVRFRRPELLSKKRAVDLSLILLTVTSGCVDAISFLALGQVFTAAMTGNTVLFGLAVARASGLHAASYAVALLGFILGAGICAWRMSRVRERTGWTAAVSSTLFLELAALLAFAAMAAMGIKPQGTAAYMMLLSLGIAMGIQGAAARRVGVTGVTTTVITSTLTGLVESLVWNVAGGRTKHSESLDATTAAAKRTPSSDIGMWISVVVAYGCGAAICGMTMRMWDLQAVWLPIVLVCIVLTAAFVFIHPHTQTDPVATSAGTGKKRR